MADWPEAPCWTRKRRWSWTATLSRFRIDLHIKDLANALDTSHGVGAQLPLTAAVMEMMQALRADGLGTADHSALACYYEKLAKVEVTR